MTASPTPVEAALALSDEDKSRVFCALLKELIALNGGGQGPIPIDSPDGEDLGYHVAPPAARAYFDAYGPKLSAEDRQELRHRMANPGRWLTTGQLLAERDSEERGRIQSDMTHLCGSVTTEELKEWLRQENAVPAATVVETSNC